MSTAFIIFIILAIVSALLGLIGLIILINGMINKNSKQTLRGGIITGIAVVFVISGVFFGARKVTHFMLNKCNKEMQHRRHCMFMDSKCCMDMMKDSLGNPKDSCCMKMKMEGDSSKCKQSCHHHHE